MPNSSKHAEIIQATDECVMCGLCLPHCPTYQVAGNEAESPRGRITLVRALFEEKLRPSETLVSHLDNCLTCLSCQYVCPANVEYEKIIDMGRDLTANEHTLTYRFKQSSILFALSNINARSILRNILNTLRVTRISKLLKKATHKISIFALLPTQSSRDFPRIARDAQNNPIAHKKTLLINSCANELFSDNTKEAAEFLLKNLGCELIEKNKAHCCGALHQHTGHSQTANKLMRKFTKSLQKENYDAIISLTTGCGAHINHYPQLLEDPAAKILTNKHFGINEYVLQLLESNHTSFKPLAATVLIHNPCTQKQMGDDANIISKLLNKIPQIKLQYFAEKQSCCGAGGMNLINQTDIGNQLLDNLMQNTLNKDDPPIYLVSSNIGCALHFKSYLTQQGINTTVCHPINLLAQQLL